MDSNIHFKIPLDRLRFFLKVLLTLVFFTLVIVSCSNQGNSDIPKTNSNILKISVFKSGEIQANDTIVNLATLEELIANNASDNGHIWYYRESALEGPPQQAIKVINLITKYKRPVSMSSKPDFSDYMISFR